jgi:trehalose utilization protein
MCDAVGSSVMWRYLASGHINLDKVIDRVAERGLDRCRQSVVQIGHLAQQYRCLLAPDH